MAELTPEPRSDTIDVLRRVAGAAAVEEVPVDELRPGDIVVVEHPTWHVALAAPVDP